MLKKEFSTSLRVTWNKYIPNQSLYFFFSSHSLTKFWFFFWVLQLVASTNQGIESDQIPDFKLPPKILCRVLNVMFKVKVFDHNSCFSPFLISLNLLKMLTFDVKAEHETDEVYAQITLRPEDDVSF